MHQNDKLKAEFGVTRQQTVDVIAVIRAAIEELGDNREVEIESHDGHAKFTVRVKAY